MKVLHWNNKSCKMILNRKSMEDVCYKINSNGDFCGDSKQHSIDCLKQ